MNKAAIKNFAIWARNKLIADVSYDARLIGITEDGIAKPLPQSFGGTQFFDIGTAEPYSISGEAVRQRDKLIEVIQQKEKDTDYKTAYQYVIEEVAYTWFNRLIAIRFMEVNDYLPSHIRVLSSESGKLEPDLVTTLFDAELPFTAEEEALIFQLKQDNKLDEVFRILFLKQCNALNEILPALFEKTKNYTELLLSLSVIDQDGVVYHQMNERPGTISAEELERAYRNEGIVVDEMFFPDADNVIPITDEEYLDDDIVSRLCAWLKAVYGADTLEANLDYIAKALGNKGSTSREIIRNYFLNDFFKDHCQTYSVTGSGKRPIYWLFDSGKQNGFKALVYLHRYTPDTIGNLRIDYLHKMQRVYESEINRMQDMMDHSGNAREVAAASKRKDKLAKQLKECREYDEKISHLALSRIELDLDDGVKVNYRKLQTAQDGKFYEVLADSKNIMVKEKK